MKKVLIAAAFLFLIPMASRADEIWDVDGIITSVGNDSCNGPCTLTVDYSFVVDITPILNQFEYTTLNQSISGTGSLGNSFTLGSFISTEGHEGYVPINDGLGDEIDLGEDFVAGYGGNARFYYCGTPTCSTDFLPSTTTPGYVVGQPQSAITITQNSVDPPSLPVNTSEPSALLLLSIGLAICFMGYKLKSSLPQRG